jgi:hypothetical protein
MLSASIMIGTGVNYTASMRFVGLSVQKTHPAFLGYNPATIRRGKTVNDQPLKQPACPWRCARRFGDSSSDGGCIRDNRRID